MSISGTASNPLNQSQPVLTYDSSDMVIAANGNDLLTTRNNKGEKRNKKSNFLSQSRERLDNFVGKFSSSNRNGFIMENAKKLPFFQIVFSKIKKRAVLLNYLEENYNEFLSLKIITLVTKLILTFVQLNICFWIQI